MSAAAEPKLKPLSYSNRTLVFIVMCLIFLVLMPVFVFYATGYRIDFSGNERNIVSVGGLYIDSISNDTEVYVNEEPVERVRIFRNAAYVQNLPAGKHRVHVQGEGLNTWVKELPVYEFLVTEASAFSMPVVPQIRLVPEYVTSTGDSVVTTTSNATTSSELFLFASTTDSVIATSSTNVVGMEMSPEYEYISNIFASSTKKRVTEFNQYFGFDLQPTEEIATSTVEFRNTRLYESNGNVYAEWIGSENDMPYYYCVNYLDADQLTNDYGSHVYEDLAEMRADEILDADETSGYDNICRDRIKIDGGSGEAEWFTFYPGRNDLVLMLLKDGLYVVEIDDRSWQNKQVLYPGTDLDFVVVGNQIYVFDGEYYLEVFSEIQ